MRPGPDRCMHRSAGARMRAPEHLLDRVLDRAQTLYLDPDDVPGL
jgi:hypothetical protein